MVERQAPRSGRPLLRVLGLALGLAVVAYGYFAYGPTGYRNFAAKHSDAVTWANRLLSPPGGTTDLVLTLEDFNASPPPAEHETPGFARWQGERYLFLAEGFISGPLRLSVTDNPLAQRQIAAVVKAARLAESDQAPSIEALAAAALALDATVDRVETLLLESRWKPPEFERFPALLESRLESYHGWAALAILRAAREGRGEAASQMLGQYLESLRILHHGQFPQPRVSFTFARRLLLSLSRIDGFPSAGLERARQIVQRIRLSTEELQTIRVAHALRWHDEFLQGLDEERIPSKDNAWRRLALGWPAKLSQRFFEPIQRRSADHMAQAWAEDSMPSGTSFVMNQDWGRYAYHYNLSRPVDDRLLDLDHGGRVRWLELALALLLFARDHGKPPAEIAQLVPRYLEPEFLEERDVSWLPGVPARAVWTIAAVEDDRGQVVPVVCRWIRGELGFGGPKGDKRLIFAWKADGLDEVRRQPLVMFKTPTQVTSLEVVDLTLLFPAPASAAGRFETAGRATRP